MPTKKLVQPGDKLPLELTTAERTLVLEELMCLEQEIERLVRDTPPGQPVRMTLDDLDEFGGYIAAEANHCDSKKKQKALHKIFDRIQGLLDTHTDEEPPQTVKIADARRAKIVSDQSVQIAQSTAKALAAAEQLGITKKPLDHFWLAPAQRDVLLLVPGVPPAIQKKLAKKESSFTVAEVASMALALAEDLQDGHAQKQVGVLLVAQHLMDRLRGGIAGPVKTQGTRKPKGKAKADSGVLYQFKVTLVGSQPPIWRRIQVPDCTLDKLHEHIQTAMGWTNSHLHQFQIGEQRYGDPDLMEENFEEFNMADSTSTMLSQVIPLGAKKLKFQYEYDFGDSWEHEILFEGCPSVDPKAKYPLCLEGSRACPPEDCGGVGGYENFLDVIKDPSHEEHEMFMEWIGGKFDAEAFDPKKATRNMKKGLPDWREME